MPYTAGGVETLLQNWNDKNDDGSYSVWDNTYVAQTFTPVNDYYLFALSIKVQIVIPPPFLTLDIRERGPFGAPTGRLIASYSIDRLAFTMFETYWLPFYFSNMPLLTAGQQYSFVLHSETAILFNAVMVRADRTFAPYTGGKLWYSNDYGGTWHDRPTEDFMFRAWGFEPPTIPPPDPVISNWCVTSISFFPTTNDVQIEISTDVPIHLFLRWTYKPPVQHLIPVLRRGIMMHQDKRFCFVSWYEEEQIEDGDTYIHTFHLHFWPECQTRWFYLIGSRIDIRQPSTSPIFEYHNEGVIMHVISLGKFGEAEILQGHVKLKEGAGIAITRVDPDNSLEIAADIPALNGFRQAWLHYDSDGLPITGLHWRFDEVSIPISTTGRDVRLYTESMRSWGLSSPHSCQFKITRGPNPGGRPHVYHVIAATTADLHGTPNQQHIGFYVAPDSKLYAQNADGVNRTRTLVANDVWPPKWVKWVRSAVDIKFYVEGVLLATHNTTLPTQTNSAFFALQLVGSSNFVNTIYMTCPMLGID